MKTMKRASILTIAIILSLLVAYTACTTGSPPDPDGCARCHPDVAADFATSMHATANGMFLEYEKYAMAHFDMNTTDYYEQKVCQKCHVQSCTQCHIGEDAYDVHTKKVSMDACDVCHKKKQTSTFMGEMPMHKPCDGNADVHYERGLICTDCHGPEDLHGDGNVYITQQQAIHITCENCHTDPDRVVKGMDVTQFTFEQEAHQIHVGKLDCITCHTGWSLTCNGCHIETRKGMAPTDAEYYLGKDKDGLVTTFMKMDSTSSTHNNETYTAYGEYFSHTVTATPKDCDFCHNDDGDIYCEGVEAQIFGEGGSFIPQETVDRVRAVDVSEPEEPKVGIRATFARMSAWIKGLMG